MKQLSWEAMDTRLAVILKREQAAIADGLLKDLTKGPAPHYRSADTVLIRQRCASLVRALVASTNGSPSVLVDHVRRIAKERVHEGFRLAEVQQALSCLEARAWQIPVKRSNISDLVRHLSIVTGTIGAAKDELARVYLAQKEAADRRIASLELRLDELSKGTEGHIEAET